MTDTKSNDQTFGTRPNTVASDVATARNRLSRRQPPGWPHAELAHLVENIPDAKTPRCCVAFELDGRRLAVSAAPVPENILAYAVRYALGRSTYASTETARAVVLAARTLSGHCAVGIVQDIAEAIDAGRVSATDLPAWGEALAALHTVT
ncbi:hypothetical protein ACX8Z9_04595 [Arthrobacter halodurans]|uniref:Uncharacterized protein n=1 Tax=Arthrobacter halodurans TaxID=516699 RepID=A0ABV4UR24_9MICC